MKMKLTAEDCNPATMSTALALLLTLLVMTSTVKAQVAGNSNDSSTDAKTKNVIKGIVTHNNLPLPGVFVLKEHNRVWPPLQTENLP
jgi:hypothetical protein